ncbi:MAG: SpoIIE family protein phosphatase [Oscillospiraceae bacterium]|nr:SpoIIE family protein phosphatase [Oscillospiraceae bacterium]
MARNHVKNIESSDSELHSAGQINANKESAPAEQSSVYPPKKLKRMLSDVANFVIYDKSDGYVIDDDLPEEDYDESDINDFEEIPDSMVKFTKAPINSDSEEISVNKDAGKKYNIKNKYIKPKTDIIDEYNNTARIDKINNDDTSLDNTANLERKEFVKTFDSVKKDKKNKVNFSFGYGSYNNSGKSADFDVSDSFDVVDETDESEISEDLAIPDYRGQTEQSEQTAQTRRAIPTSSQQAEQIKRIQYKQKSNAAKKISLSDISKRFLILLFSVICGSVAMPLGMNPLGISIICAADKYIFYIYAGLIISLAFCKSNVIVFFGLYTVIAGVKFYLKYNKEKTKSKMLSASPSYKNLPGKEKVKLLRLVHFNDTGLVIMSVLVCAISCSVAGFVKLALQIESIVYTDLIAVMLFVLISMLFTYLYCGLFDVGTDNKILEKAGICSVIFTVIYFLAPYYIYTLSIGYIFSFMLTLIAANSGIKKSQNNSVETGRKSKNTLKSEDYGDFENVGGSDEEIINRFSLNLMNHDGILSDMTRGALVGLLCGIALGDTAGAVTLGICGLVSGLFFSQSPTLAIVAGLVSAVSYSIYVAGIDAIQRYIPNMAIGFAIYLPASAFYASVMRKAASSAVLPNETGLAPSGRPAPILDRGLLVTELPANKLNNLSDAFKNLSAVFYEFSDRLKIPTLNEVKAIVSAAVEQSCGECEKCGECELRERGHLSTLHKKASEYVHKNHRVDNLGISKIFAENCVKISDIKDYINSVYCRRTEENIVNDKTKIFASNFDSIAKLLQNNVKAGKEDISFKREMSEKIFANLENMGIECENVIVIGERKKTVYIFGIKMVNYAGAISDITEMLEKVCGTWFDDPEYILRDKYIIMKNQSRNKYKIYSLYMSKAAAEVKEIIELKNNGENFNGAYNINIENTANNLNTVNNMKKEVNGDSISVFEGKDGYHYGLISDGMGSGKNAALSSRLTALLMEKLLSVGNQKDLTLEMLNSLLISKNDECFASVDLFEADLITGKASFIKAGAAPSFILRGGKLFKIQSSTVPAGIIGNINSEQTKFDIEEGDYVLMLSDGIISTFEEGTWLLEMLSSEKNLSDPKSLLNGILTEAAQKNHRKDDMSVLFLKIAEDKRLTG